MVTDVTDLDLMMFWAKTSREAGWEEHWHPLLCHMLDVGAVAEYMWQTTLSTWSRKRLAGNLGLSEEDTGRWLTFWAAAHDIGKCSRVFQLQGGSAVLTRANARFTRAGFKLPEARLSGPHGMISARELVETFTRAYGFPETVAWPLAVAIGGHHGVLPTGTQVEELTREAIGGGRWSTSRTRLLDTIATLLLIPQDTPLMRISSADALWIAGFISVADWVGSNQEFFALAASDPDRTPDIAAADYLAQVARPSARKALARLGWHARPVEDSHCTFKEAFGFEPNAMQTSVFAAIERVEMPILTIVEAPMGLGKTETALTLAERWSEQLGATGLYFALPTRATSNQMLHRVRDYLEKRYPQSTINLQLLQGAAALSAEFQELRRNQYRMFQPRGVDQDASDRRTWDGPPGVLAASWFTHRKRGLLAPFGVGTVDQALLATLQTRHVFVRLFGLGGKTVIVDEVHAYDTYMSTLLDQLLGWLAALGASVVLLSATLPDDRRRALLAAYGGTDDELLEDAAVPTYPRVSWVSAGGTPRVQSLPTPSGTERVLGIDWVPDLLTVNEDAAFALGERLREALATGGCAAVICNTVRRAQEVYTALKAYFPGTANDGFPRLDLFHARYPFEDRDVREKRALLRFGKVGSTVEWGDGETRAVRRPDCAVLVATQVIEQSLDLDFDVMVSDPAPVDLLLQRSGRLQRHEQNRPPGIGGPRLQIGTPALDLDGLPRFDGGTAVVYDAHALLRTWMALWGREAVGVPASISALIEAVYAEHFPADDVSEALGLALVATRDQMKKRMKTEMFEAGIRFIERPDFEGELARITRAMRDDENPEIHPALQALTRLSAPSANIICLYGALDAPFLDAEMTKPIDIHGEISGPDAAALLRRSVSVAHRGVVYALLRGNQPSSWGQQALVRYHRPVVFDAEGNAPVCGTMYTLHLDDDLGLTTRGPDD